MLFEENLNNIKLQNIYFIIYIVSIYLLIYKLKLRLEFLTKINYNLPNIINLLNDLFKFLF